MNLTSKTVLVTGGFTFFSEEIARRAGFAINDVEIGQDQIIGDKEPRPLRIAPYYAHYFGFEI
ncbi:MAG: hypothetical protein UW40_C0005G0001 [Parcubacteria group bacterium GW2011_GWF2_44_17]|nr:MAG: hypothetical protein UW40_C0005G0001 [Parcubacteria group bacterium GW2011_GWF2_44_17]